MDSALPEPLWRTPLTLPPPHDQKGLAREVVFGLRTPLASPNAERSGALNPLLHFYSSGGTWGSRTQGNATGILRHLVRDEFWVPGLSLVPDLSGRDNVAG